MIFSNPIYVDTITQLHCKHSAVHHIGDAKELQRLVKETLSPTINVKSCSKASMVKTRLPNICVCVCLDLMDPEAQQSGKINACFLLKVILALGLLGE